jgi:hypothetical protein
MPNKGADFQECTESPHVVRMFAMDGVSSDA